MKFEVVCDTLLPKTRHVTRRQTISEKRNVFYYKTEPYEVPFLLYVNKVVKF